MYFKDKNGGLHFLSDEDIANGGTAMLPADCVEITDDEADAISAAHLAEALGTTRSVEIKARLAQIDLDSVRPLRAILANTATQHDRDKLDALDAEAAILRAEPAAL